MSLKPITLWSWLATQEATNQIYCPPNLQVTNQEFAAELAKKIEQNRLPAEVELVEVNWADTGTKQPRILVRHTDDNPVVHLVQFLVGVDQMGNFTYVEEKVCLGPPKLPDLPRKKKPQTGRPSKKWPTVLVIVGILGLFFTLAGAAAGSATDEMMNVLMFNFCACGVPGLIALVAGIAGNRSYESKIRIWQKIEAWNTQVDQEQRAWDEAANSWYKDTVKAAQLARTDDVFGRFTLALTSTVKQVIKTLFEDRQAELRERTEKERTQKEIEEELERRKQEGFK